MFRASGGLKQSAEKLSFILAEPNYNREILSRELNKIRAFGGRREAFNKNHLVFHKSCVV